MNDQLPSRADVKTGGGSDNRDFARWMEAVALPILIAYEDGRLFDREAIDYEAEARKVYALNRVAYNQMPDELRKPWDELDAGSRAGLIAMAWERVNAAIGDSDEK